ncbi:MAG: diaminopimelate epimerase [Rhodobacteraceae bacterium]|nr:diaminopimelate epimerase [Paracoccaceae bacterium]
MEFVKMHGLGNDFVIVDSRRSNNGDLSRLARPLGDRRTGIGFDQLAEITNSESHAAKLLFWNADGSPSATCGNATRCVARLLFEETGFTSVSIETAHGSMLCEDAGKGLTRVNMGQPEFHWQRIPLAEPIDPLCLPIDGTPSGLGMGNPHCVFLVGEAESVDIQICGPAIECHALFPERTNVEFVSRRDEHRLRMRIWERGAGVTRASGSGACAAAVAACRRGLTGRSVTVETDGGDLRIDWKDDGVWKTGPTSLVCSGSLSPEWNASP